MTAIKGMPSKLLREEFATENTDYEEFLESLIVFFNEPNVVKEFGASHKKCETLVITELEYLVRSTQPLTKSDNTKRKIDLENNLQSLLLQNEECDDDVDGLLVGDSFVEVLNNLEEYCYNLLQAKHSCEISPCVDIELIPLEREINQTLVWIKSSSSSNHIQPFIVRQKHKQLKQYCRLLDDFLTSNIDAEIKEYQTFITATRVALNDHNSYTGIDDLLHSEEIWLQSIESSMKPISVNTVRVRKDQFQIKINAASKGMPGGIATLHKFKLMSFAEEIQKECLDKGATNHLCLSLTTIERSEVFDEATRILNLLASSQLDNNIDLILSTTESLRKLVCNGSRHTAVVRRKNKLFSLLSDIISVFDGPLPKNTTYDSTIRDKVENDIKWVQQISTSNLLPHSQRIDLMLLEYEKFSEQNGITAIHRGRNIKAREQLISELRIAKRQLIREGESNKATLDGIESLLTSTEQDPALIRNTSELQKKKVLFLRYQTTRNRDIVEGVFKKFIEKGMETCTEKRLLSELKLALQWITEEKRSADDITAKHSYIEDLWNVLGSNSVFLNGVSSIALKDAFEIWLLNLRTLCKDSSNTPEYTISLTSINTVLSWLDNASLCQITESSISSKRKQILKKITSLGIVIDSEILEGVILPQIELSVMRDWVFGIRKLIFKNTELDQTSETAALQNGFYKITKWLNNEGATATPTQLARRQQEMSELLINAGIKIEEPIKIKPTTPPNKIFHRWLQEQRTYLLTHTNCSGLGLELHKAFSWLETMESTSSEKDITNKIDEFTNRITAIKHLTTKDDDVQHITEISNEKCSVAVQTPHSLLSPDELAHWAACHDKLQKLVQNKTMSLEYVPARPRSALPKIESESPIIKSEQEQEVKLDLDFPQNENPQNDIIGLHIPISKKKKTDTKIRTCQLKQPLSYPRQRLLPVTKCLDGGVETSDFDWIEKTLSKRAAPLPTYKDFVQQQRDIHHKQTAGEWDSYSTRVPSHSVKEGYLNSFRKNLKALRPPRNEEQHVVDLLRRLG